MGGCSKRSGLVAHLRPIALARTIIFFLGGCNVPNFCECKIH